VSLWILNHTARIPAKDEQFSIDGLDILVQNADERRILEVIMNRAEPQREGEGREQTDAERIE
jgi:Mg2+/Co2+ transporter CorC